MYRNSFHNKWAFHCTEILPILHDSCTPAPRKLTKQQMWKCSIKFFDFNYPRPTTVSVDTSGVGMALESFIEWIFSVLWQAQLMGLLCSNFFHWKDFSHSSFVRAMLRVIHLATEIYHFHGIYLCAIIASPSNFATACARFVAISVLPAAIYAANGWPPRSGSIRTKKMLFCINTSIDESLTPWSHKNPRHPGLQMHSSGLLHVPFTQPGNTWQSLQVFPVHPMRHFCIKFFINLHYIYSSEDLCIHYDPFIHISVKIESIAVT